MDKIRFIKLGCKSFKKSLLLVITIKEIMKIVHSLAIFSGLLMFRDIPKYCVENGHKSLNGAPAKKSPIKEC